MIAKQMKDIIKYFNNGVEIKVMIRLTNGDMVKGEFLLGDVAHHSEDEGGTVYLHATEEG